MGYDDHRDLDGWAGTDSAVCRRIRQLSDQNLSAYAAQPLWVEEHANIERSTAQGGYGRRQIYELVQNGADEMLQTPGSKIHVLVTDEALYCANQGDPLDVEGVDSILGSHLSRKRGMEIGRFGLGFKSVLEISTAPQVFSRTGSFEFDLDRSAQRITSVVPSAERVPILRLATPIDPHPAAAVDQDLRGLMSWASTVIKIPRNKPRAEWIVEDVGNFPAEFLLFSPHVGELVLERPGTFQRQVTLQRDGTSFWLNDDGQRSQWSVFSTTYRPTAEARVEAGELADRKELPIAWAVPGEGRTKRGQFWAFFPTEYHSTLSGILNAPWKTNEDRQNLLTGRFNEELLDAFSQLVVSNLPAIVQPDDPGSVLDVLPSTKDRSPNWADWHLSETVYAHGGDLPSVPDQLGHLKVPRQLYLPPDDLPLEAVTQWANSPTRTVNWPHESTASRERRFRIDRLLGEGVAARERTLCQWLEALVYDATAEGSAAAVRVAATLVQTDERYLRRLQSCQFILGQDEELHAPDPDELFIASEYDAEQSGIALVHDDVAQSTFDELSSLGIQPVDAEGEFLSLVENSLLSWQVVDWDRFWHLARNIGPDTAYRILTTRNRKAPPTHVRTVAGSFAPIPSTLLPGPIVPEDGSRDASLTIDLGYHGDDQELLALLGAVASPTVNRGSVEEPWFKSFRNEAISKLESQIPVNAPHPQHDYLSFQSDRFIGPITALFGLSEEGKIRFTAALLEVETDPHPWELEHQTQDRYPTAIMPPPHIWAVRREGLVNTSLSPQKPSRAFAPVLQAWSSVLPVAACNPQHSRLLGLRDSLEAVLEDEWEEACERISLTDDDRAIGRFYSVVSEFEVSIPAAVWARVGLSHQWEAPSNVTVLVDRREFDALIPQGAPSILVEDVDTANRLEQRWGLRPAHAIVRTEVYAVPQASVVPMADVFPGIRFLLEDRELELEGAACSVLRLETMTDAGKSSEDTQFFVDGSTVYWSSDLDDRVLLERLIRTLDLNVPPSEIDDLLAQRDDEYRRRKLAAIGQQPTYALRLVAAVGGEEILKRLPTTLVAAVRKRGADLEDPEMIGSLALAVYGYGALRTFKDELNEVGLQPPVQWAGTRAAREFVRALGFPTEFAGFDQARRPPLLEIDGPPELPPLHDYQRGIANEVRKILQGTDGMRGMLSLPTGAGKTRVAVESLVEAFKEEELSGAVLWVAQTDELCEQAVQSWSEVWRAFGPREKLSISRLWASNEAEEIGGFHVVVATIAKLGVCIGKPEYDWLQEPACVIIDEAHGAITPEYTDLLEWLGLARNKEARPLVGLTATPFRGTNVVEGERLAARFGGRRLDRGILGDDPYKTLQEKGVLANVDHEMLGGVTIELTDSELHHLKQMRRLPASVEDRLGSNTSRNDTLLKSVQSLPEEWTVLMFCASVDHAQSMAALCSLDGIPSAVISAGTEPGARRRYIDDFRAGRIRVLTNYGVLTQGFDAPAVRAIYVARPTFSPNLYQQMIGRGLRGPLNGGKERCLIVNVEDNVRQFGERLAFYDFDYLWSSHG